MDRRNFLRKMMAPATAAIAVAASAHIPKAPPVKLMNVGQPTCPFCLDALDVSFREEDNIPPGATYFIARHYGCNPWRNPQCPNAGREFKIEMGIPAEICG